jgi:hypothetical protein
MNHKNNKERQTGDRHELPMTLTCFFEPASFFGPQEGKKNFFVSYKLGHVNARVSF